LKGGTFPPHYHQNNERVSDAGDFEALPGEDVNGDSCACNLVPEYRTPDGRFAKPGLTPVFQPAPVTAAAVFQPEPFDWTPLVEALSVERPLAVSLSLPQGSIVVNVPETRPVVNVTAPAVNVAPPSVSVAAPNVTVEPPHVTVAETVVNVAAPNVSVEPKIEVKPAPVKIIRQAAKAVRFRRNNNGLIESAEVTE
jgi:hypothetical protein